MASNHQNNGVNELPQIGEENADIQDLQNEEKTPPEKKEARCQPVGHTKMLQDGPYGHEEPLSDKCLPPRSPQKNEGAQSKNEEKTPEKKGGRCQPMGHTKMLQDRPNGLKERLSDKSLPPRSPQQNESPQGKGPSFFTPKCNTTVPYIVSYPNVLEFRQIQRKTVRHSCNTADGQDVNNTAKSVTSAARDVVGDPEVQAAHALLQLKFGTKKDTSTSTQNTDIESFQAENERLKAENESLKAENEGLKETITCKICRDNRVNVVFTPCRHLVCCESCSSHFRRKRKECPICRQFVERYIKIFP